MKPQLTACFPGVGFASCRAGKRITASFHGFADLSVPTPVDDSTIFPACSIAKFVTALCVMRLQEKQLISIDAPVNDFLRTWKLLTPQGCESEASIRALLCHTAGVIDGENSFFGLRQGAPEVTLMEILQGRTAYNNRMVRVEKPVGANFEYSDAGYCVLQLLVQDATCKPFADVARELVFVPLDLHSIFFATPENIAAHRTRMATGYDGNNMPLPGRFPPCPDLAASGLWTTPEELVMLGRAFISSLNGEGGLLQQASAREMASPVPSFPWTGLGLFISDGDILTTQGWGEHGQCMMKMNRHTQAVAAVMTNQNPEVDQAESGIQELVDNLLDAAE